MFQDLLVGVVGVLMMAIGTTCSMGKITLGQYAEGLPEFCSDHRVTILEYLDLRPAMQSRCDPEIQCDGGLPFDHSSVSHHTTSQRLGRFVDAKLGKFK
jgi:hypothetical protein